jgi:ATP-dependent RNA helicase HelY
VAGEALADVLDDDEMTGGDFVRHVKQVVDLLGQIAEVAPVPTTRARARDAAERSHRGVVAASSVTGGG